MKNFAALALAVLCPLLGGAAEFPEKVVPAGFGVNIHFVNGREAELDKIAAGGFKFVRMDFSWQATEPQKGVYNWACYDELTAGLEKRGMRALFILDYSNPLYEETVVSRDPISGKEQKDLASPQHPESVQAFARWAAAAAKHYSGQKVVWEIWNEPNISFWKPKPDVQQYNALALATAKAIRAVEPTATMVGPGSSEMPREFLETFLSSGILEFIDGVSVHPYRYFKKSPETVAEEYQNLRGLIERHAPTAAKKQMPIISSEWGYTTKTNELPLDTQGAFIVRQALVNLMQGVPLSIWYDWKNDGTDPNDGEQNFGTVTENLTPKPAYVAFQTFTKQLSGYHFVKRVETAGTNDFVLLMVDSKKDRKLAVWTVAENHPLTINLGALKAKTALDVDWKGDSVAVKMEGKSAILEVSGHPAFVTVK